APSVGREVSPSDRDLSGQDEAMTAPAQNDAEARPAKRLLGGRMVAAWVALIALLLLISRLAVVIVQDFVEAIGLVVDVALLALGVWWSITGRRMKRHLGYLIAGAAAAMTAVGLVAFAIHRPRAVFSLVGFALIFGFFSARALNLGSAYERWRMNRVA